MGEYYADMFGWRELAAQVAEVYRGLPADEQKEAVFLGNNYGEAAAIDVLGRPFGLLRRSAATTTTSCGGHRAMTAV